MKNRKPLKRGAPPRKRSKKMELKYIERRALVVKVLSERPRCEACPVFAKHDGLVTYKLSPSTDVHELIRRSQGGSILDEKNVLAVCRKCHNRIGREPALAVDLGLAKWSWDK